MQRRDRSTTRLTSKLQRKLFVPVMRQAFAGGDHTAWACTNDAPTNVHFVSAFFADRTRTAYPCRTYIDEHSEIKPKKKNLKQLNALQTEMTMFADQIVMAAIVTVLSRPQIAILDFDERSSPLILKRYYYRSLTHEAQEGTMQ